MAVEKFHIKKNDLEPSLRVQLLDGTSPITTLDDADSMRILIRNRKLGLKVDQPVTPVSPQTGDNIGWVEYAWVLGDTDTAGEFNAEVEVTWPGARPQTFPADGYFTVIVTKDLDD